MSRFSVARQQKVSGSKFFAEKLPHAVIGPDHAEPLAIKNKCQKLSRYLGLK
jgi:hypothetical protein